MRMPAAAFLHRSRLLNRKGTLTSLFSSDSHHEQTFRDRTATMGSAVSQSTVDFRASDSDGSDTEWHSEYVSMKRLPPAAVTDQDSADFNFGAAPISGAAGLRM